MQHFANSQPYGAEKADQKSKKKTFLCNELKESNVKNPLHLTNLSVELFVKIFHLLLGTNYIKHFPTNWGKRNVCSNGIRSIVNACI